jgi:hypothetical protein
MFDVSVGLKIFFLFREMAGVRILGCSKSSVAVTNVEFKLFGDKVLVTSSLYIIGSTPTLPSGTIAPFCWESGRVG